MTRIRREAFAATVQEMTRILALMTHPDHAVCPSCLTVTLVDPRSNRLHCWCDHDSGDIR
jgi:hypothetical protein